MGRLRKKHNWKARQQVDTHVDRSQQEKIRVEIEGVKEDEYDDANELALPSKKRKTKCASSDVPPVKPLSKKQRKQLEQIISRKEKKNKRAGLLESLQKVQASKDELSLMTSVPEMQSGRYKRQVEIEQTPEGVGKINTISGSNKRGKRTQCMDTEETHDDRQDSETDSDSQESSTEQSDSESEESAGDHSQGQNNSSDLASDKKALETCHSNIEKGKSTEIMEKCRKPATHIPLARKPDIQEARLALPILGEEQAIMESISDNPVVILCGETGSGKTTQVPQFLYEAGYAHRNGIIGVTEPRRVAAISMSHRVAQEMNLSTREVSYQIRYEGNVTKDTKIKFMTDGVLLKEVQKDFLLRKYSVIILDEAHERSIYTDILIGLISRIVPLRNKRGLPLKLIIMSATLRVEDFTENPRLFKVTPPVIKVESRQYPVTVHFNKKTPQEDYIGEAYKKICKIHRELPEGGILVFVTGQQEVHSLSTKLRHMFPMVKEGNHGNSSGEADDEKTKLPKINLDNYSVLPLDEEAEMAMDPDQSDEEMSEGADLESDEDEGMVSGRAGSGTEQPLHVLPLYSLLSSEKQAKVFEAPPQGSRLCVIATNVAETSLTIPNVKYVVDTGKVKTKFYDKVTGVSAFRVTWTSQASANQRAGRAGRTGPGHCYRLYSSAVFTAKFEQFSPPEILRRPVEDLMLQMKDLGIDKVINFPFPMPPDTEALKAAEQLLVSLGALEVTDKKASVKIQQKDDLTTKITPLGHSMACFPVSPRYGKMLSLGHQHDLLPYVIAMVAALSVDELFIELEHPAASQEDEHWQSAWKQKMLQTRRMWAGSGHSFLLGDLMVLLKAVGACEYSGNTAQFCEQHGLRSKAMIEIRKLRAQLTNAVNSVIPDANLVLDPKMAPPSDLQAKLLRQIVLAGLGDHVARRMPEAKSNTEEAKKMKFAYQSMNLEKPVFVHPSSVLYKQKLEYVVYQHVVETSKLYMKGVIAIDPSWLPLFASSHCVFSKPLDDPPPSYDEALGRVMCHRTSTFGAHDWMIPAVQLEYPTSLDRYKWFARFLLEGSVCPKLKQYVPVLMTAPVTMIKAWAKLQPRTESLLKALVAKSADTKEALMKVWKEKPNYLLGVYKEWIPQSLHSDLEKMWPPI